MREFTEDFIIYFLYESSINYYYKVDSTIRSIIQWIQCICYIHDESSCIPTCQVAHPSLRAFLSTLKMYYASSHSWRPNRL